MCIAASVILLHIIYARPKSPKYHSHYYPRAKGSRSMWSLQVTCKKSQVMLVLFSLESSSGLDVKGGQMFMKRFIEAVCSLVDKQKDVLERPEETGSLAVLAQMGLQCRLILIHWLNWL